MHHHTLKHPNIPFHALGHLVRFIIHMIQPNLYSMELSINVQASLNPHYINVPHILLLRETFLWLRVTIRFQLDRNSDLLEHNLSASFPLACSHSQLGASRYGRY